MRSPREIRHRLQQELGNLAMYLFPPGAMEAPASGSLLLPDGSAVAKALHGTPYATEVVRIADQLLAHRFPLLGLTIDTGPEIDWRRDYLHQISTGIPYFRRSPYLDFARAGDHKVVWELNRHQHLVLLAQAYHLSGRSEYLNEVFRQLESWLDSNPFLRGINWASALEVAFRALSWAWLWRLAGTQMGSALARRFLTELYRHGRFLELNLSIYFSPNTHLLGEAVALHALGMLFPQFPEGSRWVRKGGRVVEEALERQVRADGSHFEQSAYYHVYALDFFLLHRVLAAPGPAYDARLVKMAEYLDALLGPARVLPLIGDDDGGRLFHPFGERAEFGRATMATCAVMLGRPDWLRAAADLPIQAAWWLGPDALKALPQAEPPAASRYFADAGTVVMAAGDLHVVIKAGPFGEGSGGHSHSDVLSLTVGCGNREILIDPGTFTYIADPEERNRFRGSSAHNTVRIDNRDQAIPAGPFRWLEKPEVAVSRWSSSPERDELDAECRYGGFTHRRRVVFVKPAMLAVLDTVDGPPGDHSFEQWWHLGEREAATQFRFTGPAVMTAAWRSRALCSKEEASALVVTLKGSLPAHAAMVLDFSGSPARGPLQLEHDGGAVVLRASADGPVLARFEA